MRSRSRISCSTRLPHLFDIAPLGPLLDDLATLYAVDDGDRHLIFLTSGCKTHDLALVVSESYGEATYHPVAFGCLVLNDEANIGEGSLSLGNKLDVALAVRVFLAGKRPVIDEVGGEELP